ncbi:hypothetical protein ACFL3A_00170 [Pseudomonadota bacterium]
MKYLFFVVILATIMTDAQAYIGPGLGAGAIGVILGLIASIFVAVFAVFWYPIKRALKKNRNKANDATLKDAEPDIRKDE